MQENKFGTVGLIIAAIVIGVGFLLAFVYFLPKQEDIVSLPLKLEEFGDYQCPACGYYHPTVKKVLADYVGKVEFTFKNFPLTQHEFAVPASQAAEAARLQGKFIEYHDALFENQEHLTEEDLLKYAKDLGLDIDKFNTDRESSTVKNIVQADMTEGNNRNVDSTPTFFLNGKRVVFLTGEDPEAKLRKVFDDNYALGLKQLNGSPTPVLPTSANTTTLPTLTPAP